MGKAEPYHALLGRAKGAQAPALPIPTALLMSNRSNVLGRLRRFGQNAQPQRFHLA